MITRYCFIRLAPGFADDDGRGAALDALRQLGQLDDVRVTLGVGADDSAASWDLSCAIECATLAQLEAAMAHRLWREIFDGHLAARAVVVKAWNFATGQS